jgi:hypothetical protein
MFEAFFPSSSNNHLEKETNPFRLPIEYQKEIHVLKESVATDLELVVSTEPSLKETKEQEHQKQRTMYHHLLNPKTQFEENMIPLWGRSYTTNPDFLKDSQKVIKRINTLSISSPDYEKVMEIWKDTKEDPDFLERYSYMEIEMLRWVNTTPSFLQAISVVNMGSPILSFLIPIILFLMPFIIVRLQGHSITFSLYLNVLKEISKSHFIGKMISSAENFSLQNLFYLFALAGLYLYQIYQNYMLCLRFYANISRINEQLCFMKDYLAYTTNQMDAFGRLIETNPTYDSFGQDLKGHKESLDSLAYLINDVKSFKPSFGKIGEIGSLLGCYYELHSNKNYEKSLLYSFSFHGYIQNLKAISEKLEEDKIAFATFITKNDLSEENTEADKNLVMKEQYYPALINESYVTNDLDLSNNLVITGPNAAGKTTYLKTTTLNVIFTQQFGCGFYTACSIRPYTHIHSYLNIPDTSARDSLFQAESRRCKEIIEAVILSDQLENRHFCIFDELYSGTNPEEASKSAYAFLLWLSKRNNVDYILTTHYTDICSRWNNARISNWQMEAIVNDNNEISYTYKIKPGVSKVQGAIKVLRDMEYPKEILDTIVHYDSADFSDKKKAKKIK